LQRCVIARYRHLAAALTLVNNGAVRGYVSTMAGAQTNCESAWNFDPQPGVIGVQF
jgi:hypothetical protein